MNTLYLYARAKTPRYPTYRFDAMSEFSYVSYADESIHPGDIVIVIDHDESKSIRKVIEIRHQLDFNMVLEVTDKGYKHYMKFQLLEDMREDKLNQLLDK